MKVVIQDTSTKEVYGQGIGTCERTAIDDAIACSPKLTGLIISGFDSNPTGPLVEAGFIAIFSKTSTKESK